MVIQGDIRVAHSQMYSSNNHLYNPHRQNRSERNTVLADLIDRTTKRCEQNETKRTRPVHWQVSPFSITRPNQTNRTDQRQKNGHLN